MDPDTFEPHVGSPAFRVVLGPDVAPERNRVAKAVFEQAMANGTDDPHVAVTLAKIYAQEGDLDAGLQLLDDFAETLPEQLRHLIMFEHAYLRLQNDDIDGALVEYDELLAYVGEKPLRDRDLTLPGMCMDMLRPHDPERALVWAEYGLRLLLQIGDRQIGTVHDDARGMFHGYRSLVAACNGKKVDQALLAAVDKYLNAMLPNELHSNDHAIVTYFPTEALEDPDYQELLAISGLDTLDVPRERIAVESCLRTAISPTLEKYVATVDIPGLRDCAARHGLRSVSPAAIKLYAAELVHSGHGIRWPPERNAPCWCGTGVKYKKCCGTASLSDHDNETEHSHEERTGEGRTQG